MRKILTMAAMFAAMAGLFAGCSKDDEGSKRPDAPTIELAGASIDQPQEIQETMSVQVSVVAQGKIAGFTVQIDSPALTPEILGAIGLSETLDLVNPGSMAEVLQGLGFPVGDQVLGQSSVTFDISSLVPMIALIYNEDSDHKFALTVTDTKEQVTTKTLTFHLTAKPTLAYNDDADLWANTATVTAEHLPDGAAVQYRVKGAADWQEAELVEGDVYRLAPVWSASTNEAGLEIHTIAEGTGVFAASDYEVRVAKEGEALAAVEFKTADGDVVPNGDMSGWSKKQMTTDNVTFYPITYPNAEGENFWDSGNNMFLEQYEESGEPKIYTPLCYEEEGAAVLMPRLVLGAIFAPGNMYTGSVRLRRLQRHGLLRPALRVDGTSAGAEGALQGDRRHDRQGRFLRSRRCVVQGSAGPFVHLRGGGRLDGSAWRQLRHDGPGGHVESCRDLVRRRGCDPRLRPAGHQREHGRLGRVRHPGVVV